MSTERERRKVQDVKWPGVLAVETFEYTVSHGVSPGVAQITTYPQTAAPQIFGALEWKADGDKYSKMEGCRIKRLLGNYSRGGQTWVIQILDPRWMWTNQMGGLSAITGAYNQKDTRGELKWNSIRSCEELLKLCLERLGVKNFTIKAPPGLTKADGEKVKRQLFLGERYPPTGTNIAFTWDHTPPAEALTQVCTAYGLRLAWQPFTGHVVIGPPGEGRAVADNLPMDVDAPNIEIPEAPVAVAAYGAEMRIQARLPLEEVGKDWHGWPVEAALLSYAPTTGQTLIAPGSKQKSKVTADAVAAGQPLENLSLGIIYKDADGREVRIDVHSQTLASVAAMYANLISQFNSYAGVTALFTFSVTGNDLFIESNTANATFEIVIYNQQNPNLGGSLDFSQTTVTQAGAPTLSTPAASWGFSAPPVFPNVTPTDRLGYAEARSYAASSVFKWYRIRMGNPGTGKPSGTPQTGSQTSTTPGVSAEDRASAATPTPKVGGKVGSEVSTSWQGANSEEKADKDAKPENKGGGLWLPWYSDLYGLVSRRDQLILLPTKVEQVTPKPRIDGGQDRGNPVPPGVASGILPEGYTGYSRDQEATVIGSVYSGLGSVNWTRVQETEPGGIATRPMNTRSTDRVYVSFTIITAINGEQLISFAEPVYRWETGGDSMARYGFPNLVLETSMLVKHPVSDMPIRWEEFYAVPGGTGPVEWHQNDELKVGVVGIYDDANNLKKWKYADGDLEHTRRAAEFFLKGKAARFFVKGGTVRHFPTMQLYEPDCFIQQVTWRLGPTGPTTIVSTNTEHSSWWPDFPQRVRAELSAPNKLAADANAKEKAWLDRLKPKPPGGL